MSFECHFLQFVCKLQEDGLTLPQAFQAFEVAVLRLVSMQTTPGEKLEIFLEHTKDEGKFQGVQLSNFNEDGKGRSKR